MSENLLHTSMILAIRSLILFTSSFIEMTCCLTSCSPSKTSTSPLQSKQPSTHLSKHILPQIHTPLIPNLNPTNVQMVDDTLYLLRVAPRCGAQCQDAEMR